MLSLKYQYARLDKSLDDIAFDNGLVALAVVCEAMPTINRTGGLGSGSGSGIDDKHIEEWVWFVIWLSAHEWWTPRYIEECQKILRAARGVGGGFREKYAWAVRRADSVNVFDVLASEYAKFKKDEARREKRAEKESERKPRKGAKRGKAKKARRG